MNPNARKNIIYSLVLLALVLLVYAWRTREPRTAISQNVKSEDGKVSFSGNTMGTDYQIIYLDEDHRDFHASIDSILTGFNQSISGYEPTSEVNRLNLRDTLYAPSVLLREVLAEANRIYDLSAGAADPSDATLAKIWSFSSSGSRLQDSTDVNFYLGMVGLKKVIVTDSLIRKTTRGVSLDFSKSAKGYALDLLGAYLESKGISDYLVRIGGENLAKGVNEKGELWKIGLYFLGDSLETKAQGWVALQNQAISSAGDFEQYYTQDSVRLAYRLDPRTGYPVVNGTLSATVIAAEAKTADALADAILVMGWREAIRLDSARNDLQMLLIYDVKGEGLQHYVSPELTPYLSFPVK